MKHIAISEDAYRRLKRFAANYDIPMKKVVEWFIFAIIDEQGHPNFEEVEKVLMETMPDRLKSSKFKRKVYKRLE